MSVFVKGFGNVKQKTHTVYEEERPTFPLIEKTGDGLSTTTTKVNRVRCINMLVSASPPPPNKNMEIHVVYKQERRTHQAIRGAEGGPGTTTTKSTRVRCC